MFQNYLKELSTLAKKKILIIDGAVGTQIQNLRLNEEDYRGKKFSKSNMSLKGNHDLLSITQPELIKEIHNSYCSSGADIIETNTFSSTSIALALEGF